MIVDELRATVRVDAQQGERQALSRSLDGGKDVNLGLVSDGDTLCPACLNISETERPGMLTPANDLTTAVVTASNNVSLLTDTTSVTIYLPYSYIYLPLLVQNAP